MDANAFERLVDQLRTFTPRAEVALIEVPAPQKLATFAFAFSADVSNGLVGDEEDEVEKEMKQEMISKTYNPQFKEEEEQKSYLYSQRSPEVLQDIQSVRNLTAANKLRGGGLYHAMSQATYSLAPAAILLATAASVMKNKSKRSKKHSRQTHKKRH